ncbi:MAG: hypothetical protein JOZ54_12980 [Acidobacteria bacterium]|nr:hypothetical protein [Acidobacteriota bacterium]
MRKLLLLLLLAEVLDNGAVTRMVAAGLSPDVVTLKIERSDAKFDTSTDALIQLKAANVPDSVIRAMLMKAPLAPAPPPPPAPPAPAKVAAPAPPPAPPAAAMWTSAPPAPGETCVNLKLFASGEEWNPSSLCVSSSAISVDEQKLDSVVVHCMAKALVGQDEFWLSDGKETFKFRGSDEDLRTVSQALARVPHGNCSESKVRKLLRSKQ